MLGVTVLAWVNSAGDFITDTSMARDGFPSMAVAATFASPLFTMIGGLGLTFTVATILHGSVEFEAGTALRVALGFAVVSVIRHLAIIPLVCNWRLTKSVAVSMFAFYALFQVIYLYLIVQDPDQ
jgi:solute carrier family 24 (sodium/potassium/calcium exchanger), member 6